MNLSKYQRLKISTNVLNTTVAELAREWGVTATAVKDVASGHTQSARLEKLIDQTISDAESKFKSYLDNRYKQSKQVDKTVQV